MAKNYFCSNCGTPLKWTRKALPNKQVIVDLIDPHECDASNKTNIEDSETKVDKRYKELRDFNERVERSLHPGEEYYEDKRKAEHKKSTAPTNILNQVKAGANTEPENDFRELDKAVEDD